MAVSGEWLGKCICFSLIFLVQKHSCDSSTREMFRVLNNKMNNLQFEVAVYSADNDAIKETLQRIEEQFAQILSKTGGIPQTETSNNHDNTEVPTNIDTASDFDTFVTRVHKTLGEEKKIARDNMQRLIHAFDKYKEETKSEINQYKETMFGELSVFERHQNVSASQLAAAMGEIVTDVHSVSSQLVEERRRSGEMVTELKLTRRGIDLTSWQAWSAWSSCTWNCTAENGGRVQSRDRARPCAETGQCEGARKQTEYRPCNAVQFAGCIKSSGSPDNYAVAYDFADQLAQATCTALSKGYVSAVRRKCSSAAPDCNATCRSVGFFHQLFTFHGFIDGAMYPLVFAFLPGKSTDVYETFLRQLQDKCEGYGLHLQPDAVFLDHEMASRNAVLRVLPNTVVKACFFHYTQCIWRKVQATGLANTYKEVDSVHTLVRRASVLPLVPEDDVEDVWFQTLEDIGNEDLPVDVTTFTDYVTEQWVDKDDKGVWNHFATEGPRTTNHLEGWHSKLKKAVRHAHPNIFSIIQTIQQIEAAGYVRMLQYEAGGARPVKRRRYRQIELRLRALKMRLENGEMRTMDYADEASKLLHI